MNDGGMHLKKRRAFCSPALSFFRFYFSSLFLQSAVPRAAMPERASRNSRIAVSVVSPVFGALACVLFPELLSFPLVVFEASVVFVVSDSVSFVFVFQLTECHIRSFFCFGGELGV